jgi:hypothetical protein
LTESPINLLTAHAQFYFKCYTVLKNYNKWPTEKSFLEQNSKFWKIVQYCDRVISKIKESKEESEKIKAELKAKQGR